MKDTLAPELTTQSWSPKRELISSVCSLSSASLSCLVRKAMSKHLDTTCLVLLFRGSRLVAFCECFNSMGIAANSSWHLLLASARWLHSGKSNILSCTNLRNKVSCTFCLPAKTASTSCCIARLRSCFFKHFSCAIGGVRLKE